MKCEATSRSGGSRSWSGGTLEPATSRSGGYAGAWRWSVVGGALEMEFPWGMRLISERCWRWSAVKVCNFSALDGQWTGRTQQWILEGEGKRKDTGRRRKWKRIEVKVAATEEGF
jgi:hypothetical protein